MNLPHAIALGCLEGLTEFLPVSSTGHLILATAWLGLPGEGVKTFEVVIQAGAVAAVAGLYRSRLVAMWRGLWGTDPAGRQLLWNLLISFLPAAVTGLLAHRIIKATLFAIWPVVTALIVGGVFMIGVDRWLGVRARSGDRALEEITPRQAFVIGLAQCAALWPGTSRAMVTLVAGMWLGVRPAAAAEYSFLLALPTLGAAAVFDAVRGGGGLLTDVGLLPVVAGFVTAAVTAVIVMRGFVRYLTRRGLAPFGWYRLGLALVVWTVVSR